MRIYTVVISFLLHSFTKFCWAVFEKLRWQQTGLMDWLTDGRVKNSIPSATRCFFYRWMIFWNSKRYIWTAFWNAGSLSRVWRQNSGRNLFMFNIDAIIWLWNLHCRQTKHAWEVFPDNRWIHVCNRHFWTGYLDKLYFTKTSNRTGLRHNCINCRQKFSFRIFRSNQVKEYKISTRQYLEIQLIFHANKGATYIFQLFL